VGNESATADFSKTLGIFGGAGSGSVSLFGITDGTSNTILFGERSNYEPFWNTYITLATGGALTGVSFPFAGYVSPWGSSSSLFGPRASGFYPLNFTIAMQNPPFDPANPGNIDLMTRGFCFGSGHPGGANFAFCDGAVRFINNAINNASVIQPNSETILGALCTRAGGEVVDDAQY